ncbi:uncharacterized protein LOC114533948 [Dendronephthya gigantea]|uniref:uncharacterized protein LOC114533948 n=1 Tax=Dendronephthya gigantea TaxID=151771 RepID=UPI00106DBE00|nr:uncharacterized protein LOC114533948 [Dendronephthya gigantea]
MYFKLCSVVLLVCIFGANARKLEFQNCDSSAPIQIKQVNLKSSYPIQIKPGAVLAASGSYSNSYKATPETVFQIRNIKVERKILWGYTSVTGLISKHIPKSVKCSDIQKLSPIPICPGKTGSFHFDEKLVIPRTLNVNGALGFFGSGKYRLTVDVRDSSGRRIVCIKNAVAEIKL